MAGEMDLVKRLADGPEIGASLAHRFGPLTVGLLIAEMEEDDLLAMVVNELDRIDPAADQPVQVGAELDIRNPRQGALEVVELVLHLVGVIVQVEHDAVVGAKRDQLAEQLGLGVELLRRLRARAHDRPRSPASCRRVSRAGE